jgi:drug/metabolite transporter (DMT)-like permease
LFSFLGIYVPDLKNTAYLSILALFCTVGLYVAFAEVLKKIPAFTVNLTFNLEPVYPFYIGLTFIIASVILQTLISLKKVK